MSRARRLSAATLVEPFVWAGTRTAAQPAPRVRATLAPAATGASEVQPVVRLPQADEIEREAFARGFAQGERAGQEAADQRGEAMLRRLTETLQELTELRARMIHDTERQMVELALAVARRVLHREVSLDADLLIAMARVALDRLGDAVQITVKLNPDDFARTGAARISELAASSVSVVADGRIPRGGCRVESDMGVFDAGIDAQIHEIAQALLGRADAPRGVPIVA